MTQDDVIRFAREAGMEPTWDTLTCHESFVEKFEAFAKLVRSDYSFTHAQLWLKRIDNAIKVEREACAKVCDDWENDEAFVVNIADAIRARGEA